jgi:hypothetical protein
MYLREALNPGQLVASIFTLEADGPASVTAGAGNESVSFAGAVSPEQIVGAWLRWMFTPSV